MLRCGAVCSSAAAPLELGRQGLPGPWRRFWRLCHLLHRLRHGPPCSAPCCAGCQCSGQRRRCWRELLAAELAASKGARQSGCAPTESGGAKARSFSGRGPVARVPALAHWCPGALATGPHPGKRAVEPAALWAWRFEWPERCQKLPEAAAAARPARFRPGPGTPAPSAGAAASRWRVRPRCRRDSSSACDFIPQGDAGIIQRGAGIIPSYDARLHPFQVLACGCACVWGRVSPCPAGCHALQAPCIRPAGWGVESPLGFLAQP